MSIINRNLVVTPEIKAVWKFHAKHIKATQAELVAQRRAQGERGLEMIRESEMDAYFLDKLENQNDYDSLR